MGPSDAPSHDSNEEAIDLGSVAVDGLFAGVLGALAVAVVFLIYDTIQGTPLHTPSVLGANLFQGPAAAHDLDADIRLALAFNGVHMLAFVLGGMVVSYVATLVERSPRSWYLAFVALAFLLTAILFLDGAFGVEGLGRFRVSAGALVGSAVLVGFLLWRHPQIASHVKDVWME